MIHVPTSLLPSIAGRVAVVALACLGGAVPAAADAIVTTRAMTASTR